VRINTEFGREIWGKVGTWSTSVHRQKNIKMDLKKIMGVVEWIELVQDIAKWRVL
jgi:hypothetical protein